MNYVLTEHAKVALAERAIPLEWMERARWPRPNSAFPIPTMRR